MIQYLVAAIIFVVLDGFYLNLIKGYFNKQIKSIDGVSIEDTGSVITSIDKISQRLGDRLSHIPT